MLQRLSDARRLAGTCLPVLLFGCALLLSGCSLRSSATGATGPDRPSTTATATTADATRELVVSEVMSSNAGSLTLDDGSTPDWIELYNSGSRAVALAGYALSDSPAHPDKYVFSGGEIAPGACLLLYATGVPKESPTAAGTPSADTAIRLPFKLSGQGDEVILTAPSGILIDGLKVPALPADVSYGSNGSKPSGGGVYFATPTPGAVNGNDGSPTAEAAIGPAVTTLLVNEYCTRTSSPTEDGGGFPDWIELYNSGTEAIDLTGLSLSDGGGKPGKWHFPAMSLAPKAYLLLLLTGKDDAAGDAAPAGGSTTSSAEVLSTTSTSAPPAPAGDPLRVSFRLGEKDTKVLVTDARGRTVAEVPVEALPANVSKGRPADAPDTWAYFSRPTPGAANSTASFPALQRAASLEGKRLVVSEAFAMDGVDRATPEKDWVEIYNNTGDTVDLDGFGLTDHADRPYRMKLTGVSVAAKSTAVITLDGFALSARGETIVLADPSGIIEDAFPTGRLRAGQSSGRLLDDPAGDLTRYFFTTPTKGAPNTSTAYEGYAETPAITITEEAGGAAVEGLYVSKPVRVAIQTSQPGAAIHITTDGSEPSPGSPLYSSPLLVEGSAIVKAIATVSDHLPSDAASRTLLHDAPHSLPVVSLTGDPAGLTGAGGILNSTTTAKETPVEFAFYEPDGTLGTEFHAAIELHGQYSRTEPQKSLEIKLRSSYGEHEVTYPFFPGYTVDTFHRLVLRTSGQDWQFTKVRDAFMTRIIQGELKLDSMAVRNCVLYVNGRYYGLYEVREKLDQFYVAAHYGVDPDKVDLVKGNSMAVAGSAADMQNLIAYCKAHDLRDPAAYKAVLARIDDESLMDFIIAESFFSNADSGNKKFWRPTTEGGKYRWMIFDLDWALFPTTYANDRLYGDLLDPAGHGQGDFFNTTLQVKLMQNPDFRDRFIRRYANFLNTTFDTTRMLKIFDDSVALIRSEMPLEIARWGRPGSMAKWDGSITTLRSIVAKRRTMMIGQLQKSFGLSPAMMKELFPADF